MKKKSLVSAVLAATLSAPAFAWHHMPSAPINYVAGGAIELEVAGTYASGIFDEGAAEIAAYDPLFRRLFITNANDNTIDVVSIRNIHKPRLIKTIDLAPYGDGVNSVAFNNGILAVAVEIVDSSDDSKQLEGQVLFLIVAAFVKASPPAKSPLGFFRTWSLLPPTVIRYWLPTKASLMATTHTILREASASST